ncbi:NCA2-domain-containing protein [Aspergillus steynii IBT 23096]|uniref:NCA2-domain-containing protein n=1 Tax=Aspergillus steynii IBT 23096 TaxID=1392250 RepID=A0A2I2GCA5_9EURO|nr:NCA2-domain-containing protein [Aspergillus steynii IBT 23096]PLB50516.1 NCA2-domain-containing protein [Aspergillus steynii IBT 23096]
MHASQINTLGRAIDSLSVTSMSHPVLQADQIAALISAIPRAALEQNDPSNPLNAHTTDLLWLLAAKAAVQTSGAVLKVLLKQIVDLNDEIGYWEDVICSRFNTGIYTLQTLPVKVWQRASHAFTNRPNGDTTTPPASIAVDWMQFYNLTRGCLSPLWWYSLRPRILSPLLASRSEIYRKRDLLREMKDLNACSVGILMKKCISQYVMREHNDQTFCEPFDGLWRDEISRSVALMVALLKKPQDKNDPQLLEELVTTIDESEASSQFHHVARHTCQPPAVVIEQLRHILDDLLPKHITLSARSINTFGRPSRVVRYWLPVSVALFSTSTLFKFLANRHDEIIGWIVDIGSTTVQFWSNWVVHPVQRLIRTIRHDENSDIALMSRNSLEADRASLERMVIDFTNDQIESRNGDPSMNTHAVTEKVREGDLTPVLRAYERDLRNPFIGTVKGDLVRALLIQIQKTKVDVEIAIGGIDSLLKSQELVFGFVLPSKY